MQIAAARSLLFGFMLRTLNPANIRAMDGGRWAAAREGARGARSHISPTEGDDRRSAMDVRIIRGVGMFIRSHPHEIHRCQHCASDPVPVIPRDPVLSSVKLPHVASEKASLPAGQLALAQGAAARANAVPLPVNVTLKA